jgi:hypothetical protein
MTRIGLAVASVGLAATLSACGGGDDFADETAEDIVQASKDAMSELEAVKVSGSITSDDQEIELNIQTNSDGDCVGTFEVDGGTAEILGVDGDTWFRPDAAFWEASAGETAQQIMDLVGDKWVVVPPGEGGGFGEFCDLDPLLDQLLEDEDDDSEATFTKGDTEDVDGDETIAVKREDAEDGVSTGYVLVDEPHYIVKIDKTEGEDTGTVTFSEFDEEFEAEAPADDDVVDLGS